jgi:23S rRNA (pseudouridine1915-N3)-methyltransferase
MKLKIVWPGKTRNKSLKDLQGVYLEKINRLENCTLIETREARGFTDKHGQKIRGIEADALEKHIKDEYIICLFDRGKEMNSEEFGRFLEETGSSAACCITFVVGGFLGLAERILKRADLLLSLSKMTFSHELTRVILLEQIYRSLTIMKGRHYAK